MARYRLVSFRSCPWVQRVAIVLREKRIDFEFQHIEPDDRPEWFRGLGLHGKVPVLRIDDSVALFESAAICEYLDEVHPPRLLPEDPVERALARAWIEYMPTFMDIVSGHAYADTEAGYEAAAARIPEAFAKLEAALAKRRDGPWFNGPRYSMVDAAYTPCLQRHLFLERIRRLGHIERFERVHAWARALVERPSTHSFPPAEYEAMYRAAVKRRDKWISRFADGAPPPAA